MSSSLQIHRDVFIDMNNKHVRSNPYTIWDEGKGDYINKDRIILRFESEKKALKYIKSLLTPRR